MTDPSLPENHRIFYVYVIFDMNAIPRYIGKGHGRRFDRYSYPSFRSSNKTLVAFLKKNNYKLPRLKIRTSMTEKEAFELEEALISVLGRIDKGTGTLFNQTDGGEGTKGSIMSEEFREKVRRTHKNAKRTGKALENIREGIKKRPSQKGTKNPEHSLRMKGRKQSPETIEKRIKSNTGQKRTEETKMKMSLSQKGKNLSSEHRKKISIAHTGMKNPAVSEANKRRKGEKRKFSPQAIENIRQAVIKRELRRREQKVNND